MRFLNVVIQLLTCFCVSAKPRWMLRPISGKSSSKKLCSRSSSW
jgi:hypothetical protein